MFYHTQENLSHKSWKQKIQTTCYMCACRCGINVYTDEKNQVRYIDGNKNHPVNQGVICAKGAAGIMTQNSPAKLQKPLKRIGERGSGEFVAIEWDEALNIAAEWMQEVRQSDPKKLAFFTGRDQSQSLTGWWAKQFGTPNFAAHGGFCSVNMAAGGLYTIGGSFWEFGEPDFEQCKLFLMFGVAEDHDSNPIKIGLGKLKQHGKFISVNPVRTGYSAIADDWLAIKPGTDGALVSGLIHILLKSGQFDEFYLARYTNASWLINRDNGKILRDTHGNALVFDKISQSLTSYDGHGVRPELNVSDTHMVSVFNLMAEQFMNQQYSPENIAKITDIPADVIENLAFELAQAAFKHQEKTMTPWVDCYGEHHEYFEHRPVAMHAMRGVSAHSNGFNTCRLIHYLQLMLGAIDAPGSFRYEPPFPKSIPPHVKPAGKQVAPNTPLNGMPLGFPSHPNDLLYDENQQAMRIDKAYTDESPLALHGLMHMVIHNAWAGDPYKISVLFMYMANMAWNSAMNTTDTIKYLTDKDENGQYKIPKIIYADAFHSEMVDYADLILPDTTYLERHDCISMLDRPISKAHGAAEAIRQPIIPLNRDVRAFQSVLLDLGARLGLQGMVDAQNKPLYKDYADYIVNHERAPNLGPLAGWRGQDGQLHGMGAPNPNQLQAYIDNGCYWFYPIPDNALYRKNVNQHYLQFAHKMGWVGDSKPIIPQFYSEDLHHFAQYFQAKNNDKAQYFQPLAFWYAPINSQNSHDFAFHAITQRPMFMYHSWGGHNKWLRQLLQANYLYIHEDKAKELGLKTDDFAILSAYGSSHEIKARIKTARNLNPSTVWTYNAIGKKSGSWGLDKNARESQLGFLLNHLICEIYPDKTLNSDPITGQAAWYDLKIQIRKA